MLNIETNLIESTPIESNLIESTPIESTPIESTPIESNLIESTPIESTPIESIPIESTPIESTPIESTPIESKINDKKMCGATTHTKKNTKSQSTGLSKRITQLNKDGRKLNDDSINSETTLTEAMTDIIAYAKYKIGEIGGTIIHKKQISLYECQEYFNKVGGPSPNELNKNVCMKPDGGFLIAKINNIEYPLMIVEDKVQGTNDILYEENKKRQSTGNAIERGAKNIRGAEMIFSGMDIFPYVLFASGCDFHHTETISKRIEMMNLGFENHYVEINPNKTNEIISGNIDEMISSINIKKCCGKSILSVFVKAHKWNEMKHGSSMWKKNEIVKICCKVIDLVVIEITNKV